MLPVAAQASRDRKAQAAQLLETRVQELEAQLRDAQASEPTSSPTLTLDSSASPRLVLLEEENAALKMDLRVERLATAALRQRLDGLEKQFSQLAQLLSQPMPTPAWAQQLAPLPALPALPTSTTLPLATPVPAPVPASLDFPFAPSSASVVLPAVVDEISTRTSCSNATGASLPREVRRSPSPATINTSTSTATISQPPPPRRPTLHQVLAAIRIPALSTLPTRTPTPSLPSGQSGSSPCPSSRRLRFLLSSRSPLLRTTTAKASTICLPTSRRPARFSRSRPTRRR